MLEVLYEPYYHARAAWETTDEDSYYHLPIFTKEKGYFAARYLRHFINVAQNISTVPQMTKKQIEAIDLVEKLADDPKFCTYMDFEPGDMQLLNNFVALHAREGYEDHEDPQRRRHLLRLWLSVANSRPLSPFFKPLYNKVGAGELRGGLPQKQAQCIVD